MALTWDVSKVANHEEVTTIIAEHDDPANGIKAGDSIWNPVTTALVWASMAVGMPGISEDDAAEYWARLKVYERLVGPFLMKADGAAYLTKEDVQRHVGLRCNVSKETRAAWMKRIVGYDLDEAKRSYERMTQTVAA